MSSNQAQVQLSQAPAAPLNQAPTAELYSTRRISVPFGFDTPLPVIDAGRNVVVSGHGGCTDGEQVTVAITVTQTSSSAVATGQHEQQCNGGLQTWSSVVTAVSTSSFGDGPAETCGLATTRDNGAVTDTFEWCKDVDLVTLTPAAFLPMVFQP